MPDSDYPALRDALDDRFSALTDTELESVFESAFGEGVTPAEYEEFFSGLGKAFGGIARGAGRFAQQAAPVLATAAQGAVRGGASGAALGPYGALIGALAGGTGAALQSHATGPARGAGALVSSLVGGGAPPAAGGKGSGSAIDLLMQVLGRPETARALGSLVGGRNAAVPVSQSGVPVPASAFTGLMSALARASEAEAAGWGESTAVPAYLVGPSGELLADPADPDQRSVRLLQLLALPGEYDEGYDEAWDEAYEDLYDDTYDSFGR